MIIFYTLFILFSDLEHFSEKVKDINLPFLPLIIAVHFGALIIYSMRQKILFDSLNIRISLKQNIILQFSGYSMLTTPGGIGELIKTHFLKKNHSKGYMETIPVVLAEKYHNLLAITSVITIMLFFRNNLDIQIISGIIWVILLSVFIVVKTRKVFLIRKIPRLGFLKNFSDNIVSFSDTLSILTKNRIFLKCLSLGIIATFMDAVAIYMCFLAFDIHYNFIDSTLFTSTALVVGSITFIPSGIGITDLSMAELFIKSGIATSVAFTLTVFIRFMISWSSVIIGIITLRFVMKSKEHVKD